MWKKTGCVHFWHRPGKKNKVIKGLFVGWSNAVHSGSSDLRVRLFPIVASQEFCAGSRHRIRLRLFLFACIVFYPGIKQCYTVGQWNRKIYCSWLVPILSNPHQANRLRRCTFWSLYADIRGLQVAHAWKAECGRCRPLQWGKETRSLLEKVFHYFHELPSCYLSHHTRPCLLPPEIRVQRTLGTATRSSVHRLPAEVLRCLPGLGTLQLWYLPIRVLLRSRRLKMQWLWWLPGC